MIDNIKHIFIVFVHLYFQQIQCLNIKKHAIHKIHRLAWGPRATAQRAHAFRRHWEFILI
jgi:hypothetical protein